MFIILSYSSIQCGKALEDFAESVRCELAAPLPRDGTVYEMTSNVILFLSQLTDLADTVGPLLAQDQTYSNALVHTRPWPKAERNQAFLALYISKIYSLPHLKMRNVITKFINFYLLIFFCILEKVLAQLNLTLITKSDAYGDASLRSIFRLNNSHYLLAALQPSGLLQLLKVAISFFGREQILSWHWIFVLFHSSKLTGCRA